MHDTLGYLKREPVHRAYHHDELTFALTYAWSENYVLPLSHDEVVHGKGSLLRKMPGDRWQQLANLRAYLAFMWAHPGKQLLFMGAELGQESEWAESRELDWWLLDHPEHRGVQSLVRDLNRVYLDSPALWRATTSPAGFAWIDANDAGRNVFSFIRRGEAGDARPGVRGQLRRRAARRLPARAARGRRLDRGAQHRRRDLRRLRRRQPRRGDGNRRPRPGPARLRPPDPAAPRDALAAPDLTGRWWNTPFRFGPTRPRRCGTPWCASDDPRQGVVKQPVPQPPQRLPGKRNAMFHIGLTDAHGSGTPCSSSYAENLPVEELPALVG